MLLGVISERMLLDVSDRVLLGAVSDRMLLGVVSERMISALLGAVTVSSFVVLALVGVNCGRMSLVLVELGVVTDRVLLYVSERV